MYSTHPVFFNPDFYIRMCIVHGCNFVNLYMVYEGCDKQNVSDGSLPSFKGTSAQASTFYATGSQKFVCIIDYLVDHAIG